MPVLPPPIVFGSAETRIRVSEIVTESCSRAETNVTRSLHPGWSSGSTTSVSGLAGFLSVDPNIDEDTAQNPQKWNRYAYVHNSPITLFDPTGRQAAVGALSAQIQGEIQQLKNGTLTPTEFNRRQEVRLNTMMIGSSLLGVGEAFGALKTAWSLFSGEIALSRGVMSALASTNAATRLEGEAAVAVSESLTGFQKVVTSGGRVVGEIDVETTKAIVEVTGGQSPGKVNQVIKLISDQILNPSGKPVIVYGPNLGKQAADALIKAGAVVVRTLDELKGAVQ